MPFVDQSAVVESDRFDGAGAPGVVLDTNVVMDWLVFADPASASWTQAIYTKSVRWLASEPMREELAHVLARGVASSRRPDLRAIWEAWASHCEVVSAPSLTGEATRMRCTDPDDQKFVDLALGCSARWLVSRDRAVLKLARRTSGLGLAIVTPEQWVKALNGPT